MPQITTSGIISGIDVNGLVEQLVAAERAPADERFQRQEFEVQTQLSSIGSLKSALSSFDAKLEALTLAENFQNRSVSIIGTTETTVSVDSDAAPGLYDVTINQRAQAHKLASDSFVDESSVIGSGTLTISSGEESFSLEIDSDNDELAQIRDAINDASDNKAVYASIVSDDNGAHLIFTAKNTGEANAIEIAVAPDVSDTNDLSQLTYSASGGPYSVTEKVAAQDSEIIVDGFELSAENFEFDSAISGVTINIAAAEEGDSFHFEVQNDEALTKSKLNDFVSAYNELMSALNSLSSYNPATGESAPLQGDASVNQLANILRNNLSRNIEGALDGVENLASLGISSNYTDGTLSIDNQIVDGVLGIDLDALEKLLAGENGLASLYQEAIEPFSRFDGILDTRIDGLERSMSYINDQRVQLDSRMLQIEARYQQQFFAMDALVSELVSTGDFLSQQLDNLPGYTR